MPVPALIPSPPGLTGMDWNPQQGRNTGHLREPPAPVGVTPLLDRAIACQQKLFNLQLSRHTAMSPESSGQ